MGPSFIHSLVTGNEEWAYWEEEEEEKTCQASREGV